MSGHSKWSTIKRAKGVTDAKRGQTFTKLGNNIAIAAKESGVSDPDASPRLRLAVDIARSANMPKENIQRAIDRGLGKLPGQSFEEVLYEGFGPGKVAFMVAGVTDNRTRTTQEIRNIFDRTGGAMGSTGSTSYMFDKLGQLKVISKGGDKDEEILELIDLGAEDVEDLQDEENKYYLVYVQSPELNTMGNKVTQSGYRVEAQEIIYKPNTFSQVAEEDAEKLEIFIEKLEDHDDIQNVYTNAD